MDKIKSGEVQLDSPEQAVMLLAERMVVSGEEMNEVLKVVLNGQEV